MRKTLILLVFILSVSCEKELCGCVQPPSWIDVLINNGKDSTGTLESVYTYTYNNKQVFLVNYKVECCDKFTSQLFDSEGKSFCFPYGGITGKGDLKCQEFDNLKSQETIYWKK